MKTRRELSHLPGRERGFASVIVLTLLFVLAALVMANGRVVSGLRQELRILEKLQLQKYGPAAVTNAQTAAVLPTALNQPATD
jgi:hypothetical protein